ncbi:hypothetical protein HDU93_003123 [Gonapodya sp. JEL0774]|nr:hypothetical protein HDU93_003123 [Gonapodya sp. JEL0774]
MAQTVSKERSCFLLGWQNQLSQLQAPAAEPVVPNPSGPDPRAILRCFVDAYATTSNPIDRLKAAFGRLKDFTQQLEKGYVHFEGQQSLFREKFNLQNDDVSSFMAPIQRRLVERVVLQTYRLGFYGATSTGKTSCINKLLGWDILTTRSGHTTYRNLVVKYSSPGILRLGLYNLKDGMLLPTIGPHNTPQTYHWSSEQDEDDLPETFLDQLEALTVRSELNNSDFVASIEATSKQVVVLECDVRLLECGVELIDMPGTSDSDILRAAMDTAREHFLQQYRPHGIVFCYSQRLPDSGDLKAFKELEKCVYTVSALETDCDLPEILFNHTRQGIKQFKEELGRQSLRGGFDQEHLKQFEVKRFHDLRAANISLVKLPSTLEASVNFSIGPPEGNEPIIFGNFVDHLVDFVLACQIKRLVAAFFAVADACNNFFTVLRRLRQNVEERKHLTQEARTYLTHLDKQLRSDVESLTRRFPAAVARWSSTMEDEGLSEARDVRLIAYPDGTKLHSREDQNKAVGAFMQDFASWIADKIFKPAIQEFHVVLQRMIQERFLAAFNEQNPILTQAIRDQLQLNFDFHLRMLEPTHSWLQFGLTLLWQFGLIGLGPLVTIHTMMDFLVLRVFGKTVDAAWKADVAKNALDKLKSRSFNTEVVEEKAKEALQELVGKVSAEITRLEHQIERLEAIAQERSRKKQQEFKFRRDFAESEAHCFEALTRILNPTMVHYQLGDTIGSGAVGNVYKVCSTDRHVIKVLKPNATDGAKRLFLEEIHYGRTLNSILGENSRVVGPLGAFKNNAGCWSIVYPAFDMDLAAVITEYEARGERIPLDKALALAIGVAKSIKEIHDAGFIHRDIKPQNVVVNIGGSNTFQVALCDLGTLSDAFDGFTVIGTLRYMAPEISLSPDVQEALGYRFSSSGTLDARPCDIYALGVVMQDLGLGQSDSTTPSSNQLDKEALRILSGRCTQSDPKSRPTADAALKELMVVFEGRNYCFCGDRNRNVRFQPEKIAFFSFAASQAFLGA